MKIAGRTLTGMTTFALAMSALAVALGGVDYLRNDAANAFVDEVASALHVEQKEDMRTAYEGRLVWLSGTPAGSNNVRDPEFNLELPLLRMERQSEIFQWQQSGSRTKKYSVGWVEHGIDSRNFRRETGHENSGVIIYPNSWSEARSYRLGPVALDRSYVERMPAAKVPVTTAMYDAMPAGVKAAFALSSDDTLVPGENGHVRELKIGDNRTRFVGIHPSPITIVGRYSDGVVAPVESEAGRVAIFRNGITTIEAIASEMRSTAHSWTVILAVIAGALATLAAVLVGLDFKNAEVEMPPARFGR